MIFKGCSVKTDLKLRDKFQKSIHFESGYTSTIVNSLTQLMEGLDPYPIIAVFTEGLKERYSKNNSIIEFTAPKITIAIRTIDGLTETQRLETSFKTCCIQSLTNSVNSERSIFLMSCNSINTMSHIIQKATAMQTLSMICWTVS